MPKCSLFDITAELRNALDNMEVDEETGEILNADAIDEAEAAFEEKIDGVACYIKETEALAKSIHDEAVRLRERERVAANKAARLREYLAACMTAAGRDRFESGRNRLSFRRSKRVDILDVEKLDPRFIAIQTTAKPLKNVIKDAIEGGEEVAGAVIAESRSLQIK